MGRPVKVDRRRVVDAIFLRRGNRLPVASPSRALPELEYRPSLSPRVVAQRQPGSASRHVSPPLSASKKAATANRPRDRRCPLVRASSTVSKKTKGFRPRERRSTVARPSGSSTPSVSSLPSLSWRRASPTTSVGSPSLIAPVHAQDASQSCGATAGFKVTFIEGLPRSSRRRGGRDEDPPASLRGPPEALDCRAHLVMADE